MNEINWQRFNMIQALRLVVVMILDFDHFCPCRFLKA